MGTTEEGTEYTPFDQIGIDDEDMSPAARNALAKLNPKQLTFYRMFSETHKLTDSYRKAFDYDGPYATSYAQKLIATKMIRTLLEERKRILVERFQVTEDRILRAYAEMAFVDIRGYFRPDGSMVHIKDLPRHLAGNIHSFDVDELWEGYGKERTQIGIVKKVRLINRKDALDSLARTQGMFIDVKKTETRRYVVRVPQEPKSEKEWLATVKPVGKA